MSTATLGMRAASDEELAALYGAGDEDDQAAALAEADRRDRATRRGSGTARRYLTGVAAEWYEAAHADYLAAEAATAGNLLSRDGIAAGITEPFTLWTGSRAWAERMASEELLAWWDDPAHRRLTMTEYRHQAQALAAAERDYYESEDEMTIIGSAARAVVRDAVRPPRQEARRPITVPPAVAADYERARSALQAKSAMDAGTRPAARQVAVREAAAPARGLPFTGEDVLGWICGYLERYVCFTSAADRDTAALWALHTHYRDESGMLAFGASGRLAVLSSVPSSGKSTVLEAMNAMCPFTFGLDTEPSAAVLAASVAREHATILIDEADILFSTAKRKAEVRAIINAGYTRNGTVPRMSGGKIDRKRVFGPLAFAGLDVMETGTGDALLALLTRCFKLRLNRSPVPLPDILTEQVTMRVNGEPCKVAATEVGRKVGERARQWAQHSMAQVISAEPEVPEGVYGRPAQIWAPLLAIADAAGGTWPARAREACLQLALHGSTTDIADEDDISPLPDEWSM